MKVLAVMKNVGKALITAHDVTTRVVGVLCISTFELP